jgi:hypothetical protein
MTALVKPEVSGVSGRKRPLGSNDQDFKPAATIPRGGFDIFLTPLSKIGTHQIRTR